MNLLSFVFAPAAATVLGFIAVPTVYLRHLYWRRTARQLNEATRCGLCRGPLAVNTMFLYGGAYVCRRCAESRARRLRVLLPTAVGGAAVLALTSVSAAFASVGTGVVPLGYWSGVPLVALALPAVGLAVATLAAIRGGRRLNRLRNAEDAAALPPPTTDPASLPEA